MAAQEIVCKKCGLSNDAQLLTCEFCGSSLESTVDVPEQILVLDLENKSVARSALSLGNFIVLGVLIMVIIAIVLPNLGSSSRSRHSRKKACMSNMRVLQGGVEMYNMDNTAMMSTFGEQEMEQLISGKYLKSRPVCPGSPAGSYSSSGDLTKDGVISCSVHGTVDNPIDDE